MNDKVLKVCLSMGGGVSLGTFSGAALTESLKLLIIYGKYADEGEGKQLKKYDEVIVDGMSGASAGTVALTIMLRCLLDYKLMIKRFNSTSSEAKIDESELVNRLNKTYFKEKGLDGFLDSRTEGNSDKRLKLKNTLISLELCQVIQEIVWVDTLDIKRLIEETDEKSYEHSKNHSFSLLGRESLSELVKQFLAFDGDNTSETDSKGILDKHRVIFACSLTSILPVVYYNHFNGNDFNQATFNSMSSKNHTELRVLDFVFNENLETDGRWLRFSESGKNHEHAWNYNESESWLVIASTALACAAFPIGFSPVLLKRYFNEYERKGLKNLWLSRLNDLLKHLEGIDKNESFVKNSFFNSDRNNPIDYKSFNLPYIDGGTFNNEPIKEAFKIAGFQDNQDSTPSDRLILFVDPSVPVNPTRSYQLNSFNGVVQNNKKQISYLKSESQKAIACVSDILTTLMDQGRLKEFHKVGNTKIKLSLREELFKYINSSQIILNDELIKICEDYVRRYLNKDHLSFGSRDIESYISDKLYNSDLDLKEIKRVDNIYALIKQMCSGRSLETILGKNGKKVEEVLFKKKKDIARELLKLIVDVALETLGKNDQAELISIFPKKINRQSNNKNPDSDLVKLPGHEVEAFAGFGSKKSRKYAFEYGRLSSLKTLYVDKKDLPESEENKHVIPLSDLYEKFQNQVEDSNFYSKEYVYSEELDKDLFKRLLKRLFYISYGRILKFKNLFKNTIVLNLIAIVDILGRINFIQGKAAKILSLSDTINRTVISPITIRIISTHSIKESNKWYEIYRKDYVLLNEKERSIKHKYNKVNKREIEFKLFITHFDGKILVSYREYMNNPVIDGKTIDPNLYPEQWKEEMIKQHDFLESIQLGDYKFSFKDLNNKNQMLYYSLLHLDAHINPHLEYNLNRDTWCFIENTESLSEELKRKKS